MLFRHFQRGTPSWIRVVGGTQEEGRKIKKITRVMVFPLLILVPLDPEGERIYWYCP